VWRGRFPRFAKGLRLVKAIRCRMKKRCCR
jgi:hypothetical protein